MRPAKLGTDPVSQTSPGERWRSSRSRGRPAPPGVDEDRAMGLASAPSHVSDVRPPYLGSNGACPTSCQCAEISGRAPRIGPVDELPDEWLAVDMHFKC